MPSDQQLGPMSDDVLHAAAKAAPGRAARSASASFTHSGIRLGTIDSGPVGPGYLDSARLIAWLVADAGACEVRQVLDSGGGFRR